MTDASGGTHQVIGEMSAPDAASLLSDSLGGLFVTGFDLSGCTASGEAQGVSVTFATGGELVCRAESTVDVPAPDSGPAAPAQQLPDIAPSVPRSNAAPAAVPDQNHALPVGILAALAVAAVVIAAVVCARTFRREKTPAPPPKSSGIYMRMEVLHGERAGQGVRYDLPRPVRLPPPCPDLYS